MPTKRGEQQRVRLVVETIDEVVEDREAALARLSAGIARMQFFSKGPLPKREELHGAIRLRGAWAREPCPDA